MLSEKVGHNFGRTIAQSNPNDLGWSTQYKTSLMGLLNISLPLQKKPEMSRTSSIGGNVQKSMP